MSLYHTQDIADLILRAYQIDVRDLAREKCKVVVEPVRVILQASTGAGKSVIAADLIIRCFKKGMRCLFIVSGRVLVDQFEKHMKRAGVPYGIIMAGRGYTDAMVQIASKDTLFHRGVKNCTMELPPADLVIIDEAHESCAPAWIEVLNKYRKSYVIGLTATPALGNGKGLGHVYNGLVMAVTTKQLVDEGWLVPCRVFAPDKPDLSGVHTVNGDYNKKELGIAMDKPKLVGGVLENWKKYGDGLRTVVFGCTKDHAKHICDEFNQAGIRFGHVDEDTEDTEREDIFGLIADGKMMGFTNISVARRGLDLPSLECACVARPTRSLVLWLQMIGRIRRPSPDTGKKESIVIDHAGACDTHCMPDDEIPWSLDNGKKIGDLVQNDKDNGKIPKQTLCPKCHCISQRTPRCPNCGYEFKDKSSSTKAVEHADGILVERNGQQMKESLEKLQRTWNSTLFQVVAKHATLGVAVHIFRQQVGKAPWEVKGLQNVPPAGPDWKRPAVEVFPNFVRIKKG